MQKMENSLDGSPTFPPFTLHRFVATADHHAAVRGQPVDHLACVYFAPRGQQRERQRGPSLFRFIERATFRLLGVSTPQCLTILFVLSLLVA
jgi:disulfide bond formation protein DsbB